MWVRVVVEFLVRMKFVGISWLFPLWKYSHWVILRLLHHFCYNVGSMRLVAALRWSSQDVASRGWTCCHLVSWKCHPKTKNSQTAKKIALQKSKMSIVVKIQKKSFQDDLFELFQRVIIFLLVSSFFLSLFCSPLDFFSKIWSLVKWHTNYSDWFAYMVLSSLLRLSFDLFWSWLQML